MKNGPFCRIFKNKTKQNLFSSYFMLIMIELLCFRKEKRKVDREKEEKKEETRNEKRRGKTDVKNFNGTECCLKVIKKLQEIIIKIPKSSSF